MNKQQTIEILKAGHERLRKVVDSLDDEKTAKVAVLGVWTTKDVIAHLTFWNWEAAKEIDRILENKATWHKSAEQIEDEDKSNEIAVRERKDKNFQDVIKEWEESFASFIARIRALTPEEWSHQSGSDTWSDKIPITVESLFRYRYEGEEHEAGHAKQIERFLGLS